MLAMYIAWISLKRPLYIRSQSGTAAATSGTPLLPSRPLGSANSRFCDLVDVRTVNLTADEYEENEEDKKADEREIVRMKGCLWWIIKCIV